VRRARAQEAVMEMVRREEEKKGVYESNDGLTI
jgi:hypothetical protein